MEMVQSGVVLELVLAALFSIVTLVFFPANVQPLRALNKMLLAS